MRQIAAVRAFVTTIRQRGARLDFNEFETRSSIIAERVPVFRSGRSSAPLRGEARRYAPARCVHEPEDLDVSRMTIGRRPRNRATAGFTLIEVLVALALVAVSVGGIGSAIFTSSKGVRSIEDHLMLDGAARILSTSLPKRQDLVPGRLTGNLLGQRWRTDIAPYAGIERVPDFMWVPQVVAIEVRSPSGTTVRLETIRLQQLATPQ